MALGVRLLAGTVPHAAIAHYHVAAHAYQGGAVGLRAGGLHGLRHAVQQQLQEQPRDGLQVGDGPSRGGKTVGGRYGLPRRSADAVHRSLRPGLAIDPHQPQLARVQTNVGACWAPQNGRRPGNLGQPPPSQPPRTFASPLPTVWLQTQTHCTPYCYACCRLCNSCHCKAYRLKRKSSGPAMSLGGGSAEAQPERRVRARRRAPDRSSPSLALATRRRWHRQVLGMVQPLSRLGSISRFIPPDQNSHQ